MRTAGDSFVYGTEESQCFDVKLCLVGTTDSSHQCLCAPTPVQQTTGLLGASQAHPVAMWLCKLNSYPITNSGGWIDAPASALGPQISQKPAERDGGGTTWGQTVGQGLRNVPLCCHRTLEGKNTEDGEGPRQLFKVHDPSALKLDWVEVHA